MGFVPAEERIVAVDGEPVRYYVSGQGSPVVLLHGLGGGAAVWHRNIRALAASHRVYAPELWGPGRYKHRRPFTTELGVRFFCGFLDAVGEERAHAVGNSLGGLIGGFVAAERPERIASLVMVSPAGLGRQIGLSQRLLSLPGVGEALFRPYRWQVRRMIKLLVRHMDDGSDQLAEELYRWRKLPGVTSQMLSVLRAGVDVRGVKRSVQLVPHLSAISARTLMIWGSSDPLFPVSQGRDALALLPDAKLHVVGGAGHWPHLEFPSEFNGVVRSFLAGADPS